jgi:hypothetical protein
MRPLENYPNLLRDPDELEDLFLLELTNLEDHTPMKEESMPPSSMLFGSTLDKEKEEEVEEDLPITTIQMTDLPMMSPMEQTSRTTSPSCHSTISRLWDPSPKSLTEIEPELTHSLLNS